MAQSHGRTADGFVVIDIDAFELMVVLATVLTLDVNTVLATNDLRNARDAFWHDAARQRTSQNFEPIWLPHCPA